MPATRPMTTAHPRHLGAEQKLRQQMRHDDEQQTRDRLDGCGYAKHRPGRRTHRPQPGGRSLSVRVFSVPSKANGVW